MTRAEQLKYLKNNLQRNNSIQDDYLCFLLDKAESYLRIKGIKVDTEGYDTFCIDLAAFYFRSRDKENAKIPDFIKYEIQNAYDWQVLQGGSK